MNLKVQFLNEKKRLRFECVMEERMECDANEVCKSVGGVGCNSLVVRGLRSGLEDDAATVNCLASSIHNRE